MQLIDIVRELVGNVLRKIHRHIGLCLSCDSADILTSVYFSGIFAGKNIAGLPADDSADIVTYMLIADRPAVGAVLDDPAGKSCDPSGIYRIVQRGRVVRLAVIVVQIQQTVCVVCQIDVFQGHPLVFIRNVDVCLIGTAHDIAIVLTDHASSIVRPGDAALVRTFDQNTGSLVEAYQTAHIVVCRHLSIEGTVHQDSAVVSHDAADRHPLAIRHDISIYVQIHDHRRPLGIAEQSGIGNRILDR